MNIALVIVVVSWAANFFVLVGEGYKAKYKAKKDKEGSAIKEFAKNALFFGAIMATVGTCAFLLWHVKNS